MTDRVYTPNYLELGFIALVAALQPIIEFFISSKVATYYNLVAVLIVCVYVAWVLWKKRGNALYEWGIRVDNLRQSVLPYALATVIGILFVYAQTVFIDAPSLPRSFWYIAVLYPVWGIAQQFVLQNFVARNVITLVPQLVVRALIVGILFGLVHLPAAVLALEAGIAGFFFVILYQKYPNLIALGTAHGILGALVFHLILGQNQWEILRAYFGS